MTQESDRLIDRRRLKRGMVLWRAVAIVALVGAALALVVRFGPVVDGDHVARLTVEGIIVDDPEMIEALGDVAEDSHAKALIVHIDSPGGTFVGGESLYNALRNVSAQKPVVAVMGTLATSAGYMIAIAADHVLAREGSITGSIGVVMQTADITGLLKKLGITAEAIKSGPLKAVPSPLEPLTDEARAASQAIIDDMHAMFTDMVAERRGFDNDVARRLSDGRVFSGRQALKRNLIDAIGAESEARGWLAEARGVPESLSILDVEIEREDDSWIPDFRSLMGLGGKVLFPERLILDGLVSVWHP